MAANGTTGTLFMAAAIRTGGVSPDIAGALINAGSNVGIAAGAALGARAFEMTGLAALPYTAAVIVGGSFVVVLLARRGFLTIGHSQVSLSTSNLRTITSSVAVVTGSVRTIPSRTGSVPTLGGPPARRLTRPSHHRCKSRPNGPAAGVFHGVMARSSGLSRVRYARTPEVGRDLHTGRAEEARRGLHTPAEEARRGIHPAPARHPRSSRSAATARSGRIDA